MQGRQTAADSLRGIVSNGLGTSEYPQAVFKKHWKWKLQLTKDLWGHRPTNQ
jgi:hypothetical protein